MNLDQEFDAIVVGTGISGGWAAKELCENGLKTLVLERGRMVTHIEDYPTMYDDPWDSKYKGQLTPEEKATQLKQSRTGYTTKRERRHFFVNDLIHPYNEVKRFDWMRGYHVGGRSLMWGRHSYRWSDYDFEANKKDGISIDWPVRYKDIEKWYDHVESYIGVTGEKINNPVLPDGIFEPPMELNCVEDHLKQNIANNYKDRVLTMGRVAHINGGKSYEGRSNCQFRNRCMRGCPFGAYFSSNSSTLPAAERTGNMTLRPDSIVHEVIYDEKTKLATGVKVIDRVTKEKHVYNGKIIFLCASAIASTSILMQSKSKRFPNGMGNDCGELGHNIMDHHFKAGAYAKMDGFDDKYYKGRRPGGIYLPRFRNIGGNTDQKNFTRGYGYQGGASRGDYQETIAEAAYGKELKEVIQKPGGWTMGLMGFGECLPYHDNKMTLDYDKLDEWGLPTVTFDAEWKENEWEMRKDMIAQAREMLEKAGFKDIQTMDDPGAPGLGIHEMGTARMGHSPKTSVLNKYNQVHTVPNVYVTDGSFMTSASCVNPSLTYMAFTARAANHAAEQLKKVTSKNYIMNRRDALKNIGLGAGYALATPTIFSLLQSCKSEPVFTPEFVSPAQGNALRSIVDLIIPSDETVMGAKELGVHQFIDSYWKNVLKPEDQARLKIAFTVFGNKFKSTFNKELANGEPEEFDQMLTKYLKTSKEEQEAYYKKLGEFGQAYAKDNSVLPNGDAASFGLLTQIRSMTIWGWKNTEEIGERVLAYDPIPGEEKGCISVEEATGGKAYSL